LVSDIPVFREVMALDNVQFAAEMAEPSDPAAFARTVLRLSKDPAATKELKRRASLLGDKYSLQLMTDDYECYLKELL
jgi:hypothetical protein